MTNRKILNDNYIKSVINRCRPYFDTPGFTDELNKNKLLFGVGNGVLKLQKNGNIGLINGYHQYKISVYTKTNYKPFNPNDPLTIYLLRKIRGMFMDECPDSFNWFMHWLGSTLDGTKKYQILLILWGKGNNGKSIIMDLYRETFGTDYFSPLNSELLTRITGSAESATPMLMTIKDKHLVMFSELGQKEVLNIQVLKRLLGAEHIIGRQLHKETEQFGPVCGYVLLCNNLVDVPTAEEATWKRILLLKLPVQFYSKDNQYYDSTNKFIREADSSLKQKIENIESQEAFLSIVAYYWQSLQINYNGNLEKVPCPHIRKDTEDYRNKQDTLNNFINLRLVKTKKDHRTYINDIVERYSEWFDAKYRTTNKLYKKNLLETIRNSKLNKLLIPSRQGEFMKGYRFLKPIETKKKYESYYFKVDFEDSESEKNTDDDIMSNSDSENDSDIIMKDNDEEKMTSHVKEINNELIDQLKKIKPEIIDETIENIKLDHKKIINYLNTSKNINKIINPVDEFSIQDNESKLRKKRRNEEMKYNNEEYLKHEIERKNKLKKNIYNKRKNKITILNKEELNNLLMKKENYRKLEIPDSDESDLESDSN